MTDVIHISGYEKDGYLYKHFKMRSIYVDGIYSSSRDDDGNARTSPNLMVDVKDEDSEEDDFENPEGYLNDSFFGVQWQGEMYECIFSSGEVVEEDWLKYGLISFHL